MQGFISHYANSVARESQITYRKVIESNFLSARIVVQTAYSTLAAGSIFGTVISLTSFIFNDRIMRNYGFFLTLTNVIGAFQIKGMIQEKIIEKNALQMSQRVQELKKCELEQQEINQQLTEKVSGLESALEQYKKKLEKKKAHTQSSIEKMEDVALKIELAQKQIVQMTDMNIHLQKTVADFIKSIEMILKSSRKEEMSLDQLISHVDELESDASTLSEASVELEKKLKVVDLLSEKASKVLILFQEQISLVQRKSEEMKKQNELIEKRVLERKTLGKELAKKISEMNEKVLHYAKHVQQLQPLAFQIKQKLNQDLKRLEAENLALKA